MLLVLEGELTCDVGGEVGSYVVKPRGASRALCNAGNEPVRVIEIHVPGGFESYYDEYEEPVSSGMRTSSEGPEPNLASAMR